MHLSPVEFIFCLQWGEKKGDTLEWLSVRQVLLVFPCWFAADHGGIRAWTQHLEHVGGFWEMGT